MKKLHKEIILGAAIVLLGVFSWYFLKYIFYIGNLTVACWVSGIVLLVFWGISLCLAMLLIDDKRILYGSFIITLVAFGMFFNNEPFYYLVGLIILFIVFWIGTVKVKKEEKIQVHLNFWKIWKRGLPILVTGLILMISLVYYFSPDLTQTKQREFKFPRNTFNLVIKPLENLIREKLPEGIENLDVEANKILSPEQIQELEQNYGIEIEKGETIRDFLYKLVNFQLNNVAGPYKKFIPLGLVIGLFITLKIISILYVVLVILFSYLILKLLMVGSFVRVETETREVETIKL